MKVETFYIQADKCLLVGYTIGIGLMVCSVVWLQLPVPFNCVGYVFFAYFIWRLKNCTKGYPFILKCEEKNWFLQYKPKTAERYGRLTTSPIAVVLMNNRYVSRQLLILPFSTSKNQVITFIITRRSLDDEAFRRLRMLTNLL